ncbi:MAG: endonuclease/exonuclease/phosphatase family protein [Caldilineaceae bacterium]
MVVRVGRAVWTLACMLFCVAYVAWQLLLRSPLHEELWELQLSEVFAVWFYLPLAPLLVGALLLRSRTALLALMAPLIVFLGQYGVQYLPNWQLAFANLENAPRLRVMTWNMLYASPLEDEFYTEIQKLQPDIIALQEVPFDIEKAMVALLGDEYPYHRVQSVGSSSGIALWSKLPIIEAAQANARLLGCICLKIVVELNERPITVMTTHIRSPEIYYRFRRSIIPRITYFSSRDQDLIFRALFKQLAEANRPLILMGDFNTTEQQPNFALLRRQGLTDAHEAAGWGMGFTYPNPNLRYSWRRRLPPFIRIDHVLFSSEWRSLAAWTGSISASDHLYVVADLVLAE